MGPLPKSLPLPAFVSLASSVPSIAACSICCKLMRSRSRCGKTRAELHYGWERMVACLLDSSRQTRSASSVLQSAVFPVRTSKWELRCGFPAVTAGSALTLSRRELPWAAQTSAGTALSVCGGTQRQALCAGSEGWRWRVSCPRQSLSLDTV